MSHHFGCGRAAVALRLRRLGLPVRNGREAQLIRNGKLTPEQRSKNAAAAHDAIRGKTQSDEHRRKIAATHQSKPCNVSVYETQMAIWLSEAGLAITPQLAVDRYNVDLALTESRIAVEVFGGNWHASGRHAKRFAKRTEHLIGAGWTPVIVWAVDWRSKKLFDKRSAEYIIALHKSLRLDPSIRPQKHVIRGDGKTGIVIEGKPDNGAFIVGTHGGNKVCSDDGRFA
jgi:very-short-patch-repair endonuclease